jgi:hypothetical protein
VCNNKNFYIHDIVYIKKRLGIISSNLRKVFLAFIFKKIYKTKFHKNLVTINGKNNLNTKENVKKQIDRLIESYSNQSSSISNDSLFRELANGFFQAEGSLSATYRNLNSHIVTPNISLTQNVSTSCLEFFVRLYIALGKTGSLYVKASENGNLYIHYSTTSWDAVLNFWIPYFNLIQGTKYISFKAIERLYELNKLKDYDSIRESILIGYNINKGKYKVSLKDKLSAVGVNTLNAEYKFNFGVNKIPLTLIFFLGFILGDGYISVRLRITNTGIAIIPIIVVSQTYNEYNLQILNNINILLSSLGVSSQVIKVSRLREISIGSSNKTIRESNAILKIEGIDQVLNKFLPLVSAHSEFFFWKSTQFNLLFEVNKFISTNVHLLLEGLKILVESIYAFPVDRKTSLDSIIKHINKLIGYRNSKSTSGYSYIIVERDFEGSIRAYRVKLPSFMDLTPKSKLFTINSCKPDDALAAALLYRDTTIKNWLDKNTR